MNNFPCLAECSNMNYDTMQELADYLYISTSTLYRFIKMMDYESYGHMRNSHQMFLENYMFKGRYLPANELKDEKGQ